MRPARTRGDNYMNRKQFRRNEVIKKLRQLNFNFLKKLDWVLLLVLLGVGIWFAYQVVLFIAKVLIEFFI